MPIDKLLREMNAHMDKTIQVFHDELATIRTGKASPALVENIQVDYYGTPTRLREMAKIATPEPRLIVIQPWDPSVVPSIVKAINQSALGITPVNDGKLVRLPIPELDEERRKDLVKTVRKIGEDTRVSIRNIRREQNEELKKLQKAARSPRTTCTARRNGSRKPPTATSRRSTSSSPTKRKRSWRSDPGGSGLTAR
jgi:ribosome recycling factor